MSAAKHTPGPWAIDDHQAGDCYAYVIPESGSILGAICRVDLPLDSYGQGLADARLMAAAPDLLAALKALLERYVLAIGNEGIECLIARAAIAKATGEPQ